MEEHLQTIVSAFLRNPVQFDWWFISSNKTKNQLKIKLHSGCCRDGWLDCWSVPIVALSINYLYHFMPMFGPPPQADITTPEKEEILLSPMRMPNSRKRPLMRHWKQVSRICQLNARYAMRYPHVIHSGLPSWGGPQFLWIHSESTFIYFRMVRGLIPIRCLLIKSALNSRSDLPFFWFMDHGSKALLTSRYPF